MSSNHSQNYYVNGQGNEEVASGGMSVGDNMEPWNYEQEEEFAARRRNEMAEMCFRKVDSDDDGREGWDGGRNFSQRERWGGFGSRRAAPMGSGSRYGTRSYADGR